MWHWQGLSVTTWPRKIRLWKGGAPQKGPDWKAWWCSVSRWPEEAASTGWWLRAGPPVACQPPQGDPAAEISAEIVEAGMAVSSLAGSLDVSVAADAAAFSKWGTNETLSYECTGTGNGTGVLWKSNVYVFVSIQIIFSIILSSAESESVFCFVNHKCTLFYHVFTILPMNKLFFQFCTDEYSFRGYVTLLPVCRRIIVFYRISIFTPDSDLFFCFTGTTVVP
jgi:hypothetical protein